MFRIGILFGGPAREREISFSGGKTVYSNLDKSLFEPIPIFADGNGNFAIVAPSIMNKGTIRDFFPTPNLQQKAEFPFQVYAESLELTTADQTIMFSEIGQQIFPHQFQQYFDFAFIALHGPSCEDGSIQGLLEWYNIPYYGSGLVGSGVGIDKILQNEWLKRSVGLDKKTCIIQRDEWLSMSHEQLFEQAKASVGLPFVVKAPHQGSSIGVTFVKHDNLEQFQTSVEQCFFIREITKQAWQNFSFEQKGEWLQKLVNLDEGIGFPLGFNNNFIYHPQVLWNALNSWFEQHSENAVLYANHGEDAVLLESFIMGQEFSCGVIQDEQGNSIALPPTEIIKVVEVFDFNSKYKPGATRKQIPIDTPLENLRQVQQMVKDAFDALGFNVVARIDGFVTPDNRVILHDPNTIPGMSPTSIIFKQMAEIDLNVTDAITYFIRTSIRERIREGKHTFLLKQLLEKLDIALAQRLVLLPNRTKVGIIFGGFGTTGADISFAKARTIYGELASSKNYLPVPILLTGTIDAPEYYEIPLNLLFKEYMEDLLLALHTPRHPLIVANRKQTKNIAKKYAKKGIELADKIAKNTLYTKIDALYWLISEFTNPFSATILTLENS